ISLVLMFLGVVCYAQPSTSLNEEALLEDLNSLRMDGCMCGMEEIRGMLPLRWDKRLAEIAFEYAESLKSSNSSDDDAYLFISHIGADGSTLTTRLDDADYQRIDAKENIAYIKGNEDMVIDYWLNNPTACKTIMDKKMSAVGVARSDNFWVMIVAQPKVTFKRVRDAKKTE
ncbi:MAG: CAP domain-containing protein, partial [Paludibacteraceae bacterium]|nr:CAP domain-containing protein [Paludibacteraceae bacterium]